MDDADLTMTDLLTKYEGGLRTDEPISDRNFNIVCPSCNTLQTLAQASFGPVFGEAISGYSCKNCTALLLETGLLISAVGDMFRFGPYHVAFASTLQMRLGPVVLPSADTSGAATITSRPPRQWPDWSGGHRQRS
jgi:hypothetical protein